MGICRTGKLSPEKLSDEKKSAENVSLGKCLLGKCYTGKLSTGKLSWNQRDNSHGTRREKIWMQCMLPKVVNVLKTKYK